MGPDEDVSKTNSSNVSLRYRATVQCTTYTLFLTLCVVQKTRFDATRVCRAYNVGCNKTGGSEADGDWVKVPQEVRAAGGRAGSVGESFVDDAFFDALWSVRDTFF